MNTINPRKLNNSKWTAVQPRGRDKHFLVTRVSYAEDGTVETCVIEAVMSKTARYIDWRELKDDSHWSFGWR